MSVPDRDDESEVKKLLSVCCKELFKSEQENERVRARLDRALGHIKVR
jgi:hypothetical protein